MQNATKKFSLGTAIKLTVSVDNVPSIVTITIKNPSFVEKVTNASMTHITGNIYQYVYQSSDVEQEGTYQIVVKATYGGYTSVDKTEVEFERIDS